DGRVRLRGDADLATASEWTGTLWQSESLTVAGLIAERLGHVPQPGETLSIDGVSLEIERTDHHVVTSVLAAPVLRQASDVEDGDDLE
ncbi:MAG TPA: transporter associated domain-containing protein, partial [Longimicrobiales bacterium]